MLDAQEALKQLKNLSEDLEDIRRRELNCRMALGRLLAEIRDRELYRDMPGRHKTWSDWLEDKRAIPEGGFYAVTGLRDRTALDAIELAGSPTLANLPEPEREKIRTVSNARTLVKLERSGTKIGPTEIHQAQTMSSGEFKRAVGVAQGAVVRVWMKDEGAARHLQAVVEFFAPLSAGGAQKLREAVDELWKLDAAAPEDAVDLIAALVQEEIRELAPEAVGA